MVRWREAVHQRGSTLRQDHSARSLEARWGRVPGIGQGREGECLPGTSHSASAPQPGRTSLCQPTSRSQSEDTGPPALVRSVSRTSSGPRPPSAGCLRTQAVQGDRAGNFSKPARGDVGAHACCQGEQDGFRTGQDAGKTCSGQLDAEGVSDGLVAPRRGWEQSVGPGLLGMRGRGAGAESRAPLQQAATVTHLGAKRPL